MARNADVTCPKGQFTELSNDEDIAGASTVILKSDAYVTLVATADGTEPASPVDGIPVDVPGDGWVSRPLSELFPGVVGVRLWAYPHDRAADFFVSYA